MKRTQATQHIRAEILASANDADFMKEYLEQKRLIEELQEELDAMKPRLFDLISDAGKECVIFGDYKFVCSKRDTYEYSDKVKFLEESLHHTKRVEERSGEAKIVRSTGFVRVENLK